MSSSALPTSAAASSSSSSTAAAAAAAAASSLPSSAPSERQALRAALLNLMETEESVPASWRPELNAAPTAQVLAHKGRYRERRLGGISDGGDILDASASGAVGAAFPHIALPADRLATSVIFSGYADPSASGDASSNDAAVSAALVQQREAHRAALILQGAHAGVEG
jgi:hypothetical protein